jgi:hypothetical protein
MENTMNARQRRTAYRKIDRMVGKTFNYIKNRFEAVPVVVLGRTKPVHLMSSNSDNSMFDGTRPSVHRVMCRRAGRNDDSSLSPRLSQLAAAEA